MKKRIVALILVVVMSVLTLSSCGSFDFVKEELGAYATFDYEAFKTALKNIEIEDGDFTTNEETRAALVAAKIYNAVVDKLISATKESERVTEGTLSAGDVLYFVYYAMDDAGNMFFGSDMDKSSLTASSSKANHVIKLDDYFDEDEKFFSMIKEKIDELQANNADFDIKNCIYTALSATDIKNNFDEEAFKEAYTSENKESFEESYKAENPEATDDDVNKAFEEDVEDALEAALEEAIKVNEGDVVYITYTRSYKKPLLNDDGTPKLDDDGKPMLDTVTEKVAYEKVTLSNDNPFHAKFLAEGSVAKVGSAVEAFVSKDEEGKITTAKEFDVVDGETTYTYSSVKILWKLEKDVEPMFTFTHTPYDSTKKVTPDSLTDSSAEKIDLKDKELTYYFYPVYAIDAPAYEDITANDILYYVYGSKITSSTFETLGEEGYVNGEEKVEDLIKKIAEIFDTKSTENEYYKEGGSLYDLNKAYNDAVTAGGSKPSDAQQDAIDDANEALTDAQNALLKDVIAKIVEAKNGDKILGDEIEEEYYEDNFHSLKEAYDADIIEKVQTAVWNLIDESVNLTGEYPEKLLKEYTDHLYEYYEYEFYKGDYSSGSSTTAAVSNYDKYEGSFEAYLIATLKLTDMSDLDAALEKEAKTYIDPIIKIYVVAKACKDDALAVLESYVQADIDGGAYHVDEEYYEELYGDKAAEKIEAAKKNAEENKQAALDESDVFLIDDAFMKEYKKEIGSAYYNDLLEQYGEINLRAGFQFNKLFYYLTSTNIALNEDGDHTESCYVERDGSKYIDFRTVQYTIKVETETETEGDAE